ncbi:MAG: hypothetical protein NTW14_14030 [bacterium]|nr:hypothetical protein [bacterium]
MSWDEQIRARLAELRSKVFHLQVSGGLWNSLSVICALVLTASLAELAFHFQPAVRLALMMALLLLLLATAGFWIVYPILRHWIRPKTDQELALAWGYSLSRINDRLLNALQVFENRTQDRTSPELSELALRQVAEELSHETFTGVLDVGSVKRARGQALFVVGIWALSLLISQGSALSAFSRILQPGRDFKPLADFTLALAETPGLIIRGEPFDIIISGQGRLPESVGLHIEEIGADPVDHTVKFDPNGKASFRLENPQNDLRLYAHSADVVSNQASIRVKSRPYLKNLEARWFPPAYSKLPTGVSAEKRGDVSALKGSRVRITVQADRRLKEAVLRITLDENPQNPTDQPMELDGDEATAELLLLKSGHYNLLIKDNDNISNAAPVDYSLWPIQDEWPTINILYPPPEAELNESLLIPIKAGARDDFAISRIRLGYQLVKGGGASGDSSSGGHFSWKVMAFSDLGEGTALVDQLWDLNELNLLPGDLILYKLEAQDNDQVSGPKTAETPVQRLRFPTMEEIFARVEEHYGNQEDDITEALDRAVNMKKELEELRTELKKNPDLTWEEKKKVEELLKKQEETTKQVEDLAKRTDELIQKMQENQLLSPETMEKYQQLQKMLSEVMTPELAKAMKKLQEALKQQNPEDLRQSLEQFALNQEEFQQKMEKALNILKQLKQEMKLDELTKRAEQLLEKQQEINSKLDQQKKPGPNPEGAQAEKDLQKEMADFEKEFQDAKEMMADSPQNPEQEMKAAEQIMQENQFQPNMGQMSQDMQQGDSQQAQQKGSKLESGLKELSQTMKKAKESMVNTGKQQLTEELRKISHDLLSLSFEQEALMDTSSGLDQASPRFRTLAQEQQTLKNHLEETAKNLYELSQKSYFITPQIGSAFDQAMRGMDQALMGYTARSPQSVTGQQQTAMGGMNRAIMEIGQSLDQISSSSSSTGFSEMMEQLAQMSKQQAGLNQGTQNLIPMPGGTNPGQLSMQQQAGMSRMAAEQEALRQELESWYKANQEASKLMGRLGELGEEMKAAAEDLKNQQVDQRTLQRQERILRRLLDAQKSVREQEYKKERLSRTAEGPYSKPSPDPINLGLTPDEMRENLLKALKEGYSRDYQQLIRDYFEALSREQ